MEEVKTVIDNTKDWYDLADTALKIGLGGFIGGFFTYITTKSNHKHEISKEKFNRKIEMLNEANTNMEKYFSSAFKLLNIWYGFSLLDHKNIKDMDRESQEKYFQTDIEYTNTTNELLLNALSKLEILGLEEMTDAIRQYEDIIMKKRNSIIEKKLEIPSTTSIDEIVSKTTGIKTVYHQKLKEYFDSLK